MLITTQTETPVLLATKIARNIKINARLEKALEIQKRKNAASQARIEAYIEQNAALKAAIKQTP